jgi:hypothetical protein
MLQVFPNCHKFKSGGELKNVLFDIIIFIFPPTLPLPGKKFKPVRLAGG